MTTRTYASPVAHTATAGFRAWGSEFNTNLAATGLVQTADTGQINWTTVAYNATINTVQGYEIWRLADSSLYFRIEYGTALVATSPGIWLQVGTGSDGAGILTGQTSTRYNVAAPVAPISTVVSYTTYMCVTASALAVYWKAGSTQAGNAPQAIFMVGKTVDNTGAPTTDGYGVLTSGSVNAAAASNPSLQSVRLASNPSPSTYNASTYFSMVPGNVTSSLVETGTINQIYMWWLNVPDVQPFLFGASYVRAELGNGNTFSVALVGMTPHTYLTVGVDYNNKGYANNTSAVYGGAMIWE